MQLPGLHVVVTGANGSLGAELCGYLVQRGAVVTGMDIGASWEQSLPANFSYMQCDLTDEAEAASVFSSLAKISVLVNLAGRLHSKLVHSPFGKPRRLQGDEWQSVIDANLRTTYIAGSLAIEQMVDDRSKGLVINIGSIMAYGEVGQSAYAAAKAGVQSMALVWAKELGPAGIRAVAIAPGFFDSKSTSDALSEGKLQEVKAEIPSRRLGAVREFCECVEMVICNDYINGTVLTLDGGVSLR